MKLSFKLESCLILIAANMKLFWIIPQEVELKQAWKKYVLMYPFFAAAVVPNWSLWCHVNQRFKCFGLNDPLNFWRQFCLKWHGISIEAKKIQFLTLCCSFDTILSRFILIRFALNFFLNYNFAMIILIRCEFVRFEIGRKKKRLQNCY